MNQNIENQDILKEIIFNTYQTFYQKYNDADKAYQNTLFALEVSLKENHYNAFTNTNYIRTILKTYFPQPEDFNSIVLDNSVDMIIKGPANKSDEIALFNAIVTTNNLHDKNQVIIALKEVLKNGNYNRFSRFYKNETHNYRETLKTSLSPEAITKIIARTFTSQTLDELSKSMEASSNKINKQYENQISDFHIHPYTVNQCRLDVLSNKQKSKKRQDYSYDDLYASMDIGNIKENEEDSTIILTHPQNPNFKILVVADGVGGLVDGEVVSTFITQEITRWFEQLDPQYFVAENLNALTTCFNEKIQDLNQSVYHTYRRNASSTFVGAIVSEKETIISHVGDSRAYTYKQGELKQLTDDHSLCYYDWKAGTIKDKADIPFHKDSNRITKGIGLEKDVNPTTCILSNSNYDTLLLFSDGVTDCLSDDQIKTITSNTNIKELAKALIDVAKTNENHQNYLPPDTYYANVPAGKDNMTVAVYDNRSKDIKEEEGR